MHKHARIVGVDVSKAYLDLADTTNESPWRVANSSDAIATLLILLSVVLLGLTQLLQRTPR